MEFLRYLKVPGTLSEELKKTLRDSKKGGNK